MTPRLATNPDFESPTRNTASAATRKKVMSSIQNRQVNKDQSGIAPPNGAEVKLPPDGIKTARANWQRADA
ncbi:MAG TPA: hypothetical protein VNS12_03010 [Pelagibacterium sp.]|nr:hypothetical protein [Pelagibacterium sp.]